MAVDTTDKVADTTAKTTRGRRRKKSTRKTAPADTDNSTKERVADSGKGGAPRGTSNSESLSGGGSRTRSDEETKSGGRDAGASESKAPNRKKGKTKHSKRSDSKRSDSKRSDSKRSDSEASSSASSSSRESSPNTEKPGSRREDDRSRRRNTPSPSEARSNSSRIDSRAVKEKKVRRKMLINASSGDECRVAILADGRLEELFIERLNAVSNVGNIYKGRVTNVEPSIQAAFVDFGHAKHGFLHISDVQPQYFSGSKTQVEDVGKKIPRRDRPLIQHCFRRGQEVIVQITKEGVGTKGPTLTTYLSIPGRFLVMMPGMNRLGVSRKIEDDDSRRHMRDILNELELPKGMGFILRTAGLDRNKRELQSDLNYLRRLWKTVVERVRKQNAPAELYQESDLVIRTIRDVFSTDFSEVIVDDRETAEKARQFLQVAMPRSRTSVTEYEGRQPLFHRYGIEQEIDRINGRQIPLPSGGSIVIDSTEAMVAIDVNSGKFRSIEDAEQTAYQTNLEAGEEIARQLRLRDLGGLIVCDFIDMRMDKHKRSVERALRDALKRHKERVRVLRMSQFGLIEITRQRQRPSITRSIYTDCAHCGGRGLIKRPESIMLEVMRVIQSILHREDVQLVRVKMAMEVAFDVLNRKRSQLNRLEQESGKRILMAGDPHFTADQVQYECEDARGRPVESGF